MFWCSSLYVAIKSTTRHPNRFFEGWDNRLKDSWILTVWVIARCVRAPENWSTCSGESALIPWAHHKSATTIRRNPFGPIWPSMVHKASPFGVTRLSGHSALTLCHAGCIESHHCCHAEQNFLGSVIIGTHFTLRARFCHQLISTGWFTLLIAYMGIRKGNKPNKLNTYTSNDTPSQTPAIFPPARAMFRLSRPP